MDIAKADAWPSEPAVARVLTADESALGVTARKLLRHTLHATRAARCLRAFGPYGLVVAAVAPSVAWLVRDKSVWPFDPAWYGEVSLVLYAGLLKTPTVWPRLMLQAFAIKAPAIAWIGQFFVPIGAALGSIELGLMASILLVQAITLCVLLGAYRAQVGSRLGPALVGCLVVAASPLFVAMSHQYYVEPLQDLAVAWFIAIITFGPHWRRSSLMANLVGASAFALLVKASSPLYCIGPGLFGVWLLLRRRPEGEIVPKGGFLRTAVGLLASFGLAAGTLGWYLLNRVALANFVLSTSSGSVAELFGVHDSFQAKLWFWLEGAQHSFFSFSTLVALCVIVGLAAVLSIRQQVGKRELLRGLPGLSTDCVMLALGQILLVLGVFSVQVNDEQRYLLPLAPYIGLLVAVSLAKLNLRLVTLLAAGVVVFQWTAVYAQALGFSQINPEFSYWLLSPQADNRDFEDVEAAVTSTCGTDDAGRYNIVGVELGWFNANSLSFFEAKHFTADHPRCFYTSLGFAETDPDRAWDHMFAVGVDYFVSIDPTQATLNSDSFNRVSLPVLERVRTSRLFVAEPIPNHPRVVLLKRAQ